MLKTIIFTISMLLTFSCYAGKYSSGSNSSSSYSQGYAAGSSNTEADIGKTQSTFYTKGYSNMLFCRTPINLLSEPLEIMCLSQGKPSEMNIEQFAKFPTAPPTY